MDIKIRKIDRELLERDDLIVKAAELVMESYREETMVVPCLPVDDSYTNVFQNRIKHLLDCGSGVAAFKGDKLLGFLVGFEIDEFFGRCKGIYVPVYGHGADKTLRKSLYQRMYKSAAELWVKNGNTNHAITLLAHLEDVINTWFWLGFGLRCIEAMREVKPINNFDINADNTGIQIRKAEKKDILYLADIQRIHNLYYRNSPLFMPNEDEDPVQYLKDWWSKENRHLWLADDGDKPLAYMRIQNNGESFVSEHPTVMNITGAYVDESARKSKIATAMLASIQDWLSENNYRLCGVEFESFNILGSSFWTKYFTPYTFSLVRRIDERILS
ncbi:MAG: N-acetyltransferase family protein [bacterium]